MQHEVGASPTASDVGLAACRQGWCAGPSAASKQCMLSLVFEKHTRACVRTHTHTHTHKKRPAGLGLRSGWERPRLRVRPDMPAKGSETPHLPCPALLSHFLFWSCFSKDGGKH